MKLLTRTTIRKKRYVLKDVTYLFHFKDPGKNSASALRKKILKELVPPPCPGVSTDLEGILDKTVIDKLLMVQSRPEDKKLDLLILPLPHCFLPA